MRDATNLFNPVLQAGPAVMTATPTPAPAAADLQGHNSALIEIGVGAGGITFTGTNRLSFVAEHSDDGAAFVAVETGDIVQPSVAGAPAITGGVIQSHAAAKPAASLDLYGYIGDRRYLRVTPTFGGTHATGTPVQVVIHRGHPERALS